MSPNRVLLLAQDGAILMTGWIPPYKAEPEVVTWNGRVFLNHGARMMDGYEWRQYREARCTHDLAPNFWCSVA